MDQYQQTSDLTTRALQSTTAQLLIGPASITHQHVIARIQQLICPHQGCGVCHVCYGIRQNNYYALTWITPKDRYVLDDFIPLMQTIALQLEEHQRHALVIEHADMLSPACANSLLKIIEEPPQGYYFFILAQSPNRILPTLRSRCISTFLTDDTPAYTEHPLLACFIQEKKVLPSAFMKLIETSKLTEQETSDFLDQLLHYVLKQIKQLLTDNKEVPNNLARRLSVLKKLCRQPVVPGSSKLIWRELYLQWAQG